MKNKSKKQKYICWRDYNLVVKSQKLKKSIMVNKNIQINSKKLKLLFKEILNKCRMEFKKIKTFLKIDFIIRINENK